MTAGPAAHLEAWLAAGRAARAYTRASAYVAVLGRAPVTAHVGGASADTCWDVASLTKPMAIVTLAMRGVSEGWLDLDAEVARASAGARAATVRDLLAHRSGLPAHVELAARLDAEVGPCAEGAWAPGTAAVRERVERWLGEALDAAPTAPGTIYSDLGYMLLGWHLERRVGASLDGVVAGFRPADAARCAPMGWCPRRGRALRGEVHDTNAWVLGGVAGHAGIFATVEDVGRWAATLAARAAGRGGPGSARVDGVRGEVVRDFWGAGQRHPREAGATWVLGWDTPSAGYSSAGSTVAGDAVGHLGFTGASVWIEPGRGRVTALLSDRVSLGPSAQARLRAFRPRLHDAVRAMD